MHRFFNGIAALFELLLLRIYWAFRPAPAAINPRKILVFGYMGLGDLLLFSPALRNLKKLYPSARVTLLTAGYSGAPSLAEGLSGIDEIKSIDWKAAGFSGRGKVAQELRAENYDLVVGTYISPVRYFMWALRDVPVRVGSCRQPHGWSLSFDLLEEELFRRSFFNKKVFLTGHNVHEIDHGLAVLCQLRPSQSWERSVAVDDPAFGDDARVKKEMAAAGFPADKPVIALHPGVSINQRWKQWPAERWAELTARLLKEWNAGVVVFATPSEWNDLKPAFAGVSGAVTVYAPQNALLVRRLLSRCAVFIGNDSGLGHMAVSAGTPSVHIFGPTDPAAFGPWVNDIHTVVKAGADCEPTVRLGLHTGHKSACGHGECVKEISVEAVYQAAAKKLSARGVRAKAAA